MIQLVECGNSSAITMKNIGEHMINRSFNRQAIKNIGTGNPTPKQIALVNKLIALLPSDTVATILNNNNITDINSLNRTTISDLISELRGNSY